MGKKHKRGDSSHPNKDTVKIHQIHHENHTDLSTPGNWMQVDVLTLLRSTPIPEPAPWKHKSSEGDNEDTQNPSGDGSGYPALGNPACTESWTR